MYRDVGDLLEALTKMDMMQVCHDGLVDSHEEFVRQQRQQMADGLRSDGKFIYRLSTGDASYSPSYAKKKGKSKPIDLHDTGSFYNEEFLVDNGNDKTSVVVDSADWKSGMLQEAYGTEIFGLNDESVLVVAPSLQQAATDELKIQLAK